MCSEHERSYERKHILASCLLLCLGPSIFKFETLCYSFNRQSSNKYSKRSIATKLDFKSYIMENIHTTQVDLHRGGGEVDLHWGGGFT